MNGITDPIRALHVDDDPDLAELTGTFLEQRDDRITVETAASVSEGLAVLAEADIDCIISDYDMPGQNGIEFLETIREEYPDLPFILFTGKGSEEIASDAISAGVTDYLQKESGTGQYAVLANRIRNAVEQHRTKREIEASQKRLSLFVEQSPLGVMEFTEDLQIVGLNQKGEEILGYDESELRGRTWEAIVSEASYDDVESITDNLADATGGYHSINENVRADGETIVCEWHNRVVTDENGDVVTIVSQFRDVTEREDRKRELERTNALLSTLFETLPVGVLAEDTARNVLAANRRLFDMFEMPGTPADVVGEDCEQLAESVSDAFAEPTAFVERTNELVADQRSVSDERWSLDDGRTLARSHRPIELPEGRGHLWVYHDVTDRAER